MTITIPDVVSSILGLVVPILYGFIKSPTWSSTVNRIVSIALSLVTSAVVLAVYYLGAGFDASSPAAWAQAILLGLVVSQAAYALGLKTLSATIEASKASDPTPTPTPAA